MGIRVDLRHGDCLSLIPQIDRIDAVVTDPPYLNGGSNVSQFHSGVATVKSETRSVALPWGYELSWIELVARLKPKHWIVFCHFKMLGGLCSAIENHAEISCVFVWRKSNAPQMARPVPRMDCEFIVWARSREANCGRMREFRSQVIDVPQPQAGCMATERILIPGSGKAAHPCQKPLAIVQPFVDRIESESILDPFMGTGTTGVACVNAGCHFIGIEKDRSYLEMAKARIAAAQADAASRLAFAD